MLKKNLVVGGVYYSMETGRAGNTTMRTVAGEKVVVG